MDSLREVRTLTRRILAFLNADPRQQLPRGTVAPLRGRDRMLLRLIPVFLPYALPLAETHGAHRHGCILQQRHRDR
jgi:hypothetical protein